MVSSSASRLDKQQQQRQQRKHQYHRHPRLRRLVRAHVSFRRRVIRSAALVLAAAAVAAVVVITQDLTASSADESNDDFFVPFPEGGGGGNKTAMSASSSQKLPPLSRCRTWIPLMSAGGKKKGKNHNVSHFDLVRSCAVESALARSAALPVCILLDVSDARDDIVSSVPWLNRLKLRYPPGSLLTFAPSLDAVFQGTPLEEATTTAASSSQRDHNKSGDPSTSSKGGVDSKSSDDPPATISPAFEPFLLWALLWRYGGLVLSTNTVLVQSLETYYSFLWFDPVLSEVSPYFFRLQEPNHRLMRMVLEHFAEQSEMAAANMEEEEEEEEDGEEQGREGTGSAFRLSETDWSRIVESFCGMSITEATHPRMCHDVEIISPSSVKALAAGDRSSPPPPGGLSDADYVALNVLDGVRPRNKLWMREACPVTHGAMFVN